MIRIAIVDDEKNQIQKIQQIVETYFSEHKLKYDISSYTNGEAFLAALVSYDLIFLDIQMNGIDGIETAQKLRIKNKTAIVFFVTSYQDYIQKSMTIHPFAFIVKPYTEEVIRKNLNDYLSYTNSISEKKSREIYQIHTLDNRQFQVNLDQILYFVYLKNRTVRIELFSENYLVKDGLMQIYAKLDVDYFIMPNQSFIVNLHNIREIDGKNKKIIMKNGDFILIARRKYNDVIEAMNQYIAEGMW